MAKVELSKADKKAARTAKRAASKERRGQFWQAFQMQRKDDKALIPILVGTVVLTAVVFFLLGLLGAGALTFSQTPQYESEAKVFISTELASGTSSDAFAASYFVTQRVTSYA